MVQKGPGSREKTVEMDVEKRFKRAQEVASEVAGDLEADCVFQIGSSLREEDFTSRSDLNLIAVSEGDPGKMFRSKEVRGIETRVLLESRKEFLELVEKGSPMELLAWKCGRILKGKGIREELDIGVAASSRTIEGLIHSALNSYEEMLEIEDNSFEFKDQAYYSFRDLSRALVAMEEGVLAGRDREIKNRVANIDEKLSEKFWNIRNDRHEGKVGELDKEEKIMVVETLAQLLCSELGLSFLARDEAKEKIEENGLNSLKNIMYDFKSNKVLIVGEKDIGKVVSLVYDLETGEQTNLNSLNI